MSFRVAIASLRLSARVRRAGSFLVYSDKKVTKETPPRMPRSRDRAARVREVRPGFVERTSVYVQRTRAHRARDPLGISVLPSPRQTGTRSSRAPPSALRAPSPALRAGEGKALAFCFGCLLLIFLPFHRTEHRRRRRGKGAHVRAQGCASSRRPAGAEKRRAPRALRARGAVSGRVSFGDFSLHEQRKVTRSPAGRVEAPALESNKQKSGVQTTRATTTSAAAA